MAPENKANMRTFKAIIIVCVTSLIFSATSAQRGTLTSNFIEDFIVNAFKTILPSRRQSSQSQTDFNAVDQFLRSRASKTDSSSKSIQERNSFTDKIDEIDRRSKEKNQNVSLPSRLLTLFGNILT